MKFTPEEMAIDAADLDASDWVPVGRGPKAIFNKPADGRRMVELDADVAAVFKDQAAVNNALRKLIEAVPATRKRRKSA